LFDTLKEYWNLQKTYMGPFRFKIIFLGFLLVVNMLLQIINPQIIRYYIDSVTTAVNPDVFTNAALLYIGIAIVQQAVFVLSVYVSQDVAWGSTNNLRADLFRHGINLDMSFHNEYRPGDLIERIDGDVTTLSNFLSQFTLLIISNTLIIGGILTVLYLEDIYLGIAFSLFTGLSFLLIYKTRDISVSLWRKVRQASMNLMGMLQETMDGTEDIKGLGASEFIIKKYHYLSRDIYQKQMRASIKTSTFIMVIYGMEALSATLVFGLGVPLYQSGILSLGTVVMINLYAGFLLGPIIRILRQLQELQLASASIKRIKEIFNKSSKIQDIGMIELQDDQIELEFDKLTFEYLEGNPILHDVTFTLKKNRSLGLIGHTGSGKTTISRLVFRLYEPQKGAIRINGNELREYPLTALRRKIAIVTQDVQIFEATLRDNITFFDESIPDSLILEAIRDVGLYSWFESLEQGLETKLSGEQGLSAGESQLLALTRVFLKNPNLVILDEASSRLDPATEGLIEKAIDKLLKNRTSIIIAHRLSTLDRTDDILLLENGKVSEFGKRVELAQNANSKYYKLMQTGLQEVLV
jgi:ATP-binding cassette subfamily B protein